MPLSVGGQYTDSDVSYSGYNTAGIDAVNAANRESRICRYPLKRIESGSDYLMIKVVKYEPPGLNILSGLTETKNEAGDVTDIVNAKDNSAITGESFNANIGSIPANQRLDLKKLKYLVYLPIPQSVTDNTSVTWGEDSLDPLAAFGLSFGGEAIQSPVKAVEKYFNLAKEKLGEMFTDESTKKAVIAALAGQAYSNLGNVSATGVVARATGQILNPNMELLFDGVSLRSFVFTYDMVARSKKEGDEIKKIIKIFKRSMAARSNAKSDANSGVFISSPDVFQLEYRKGNASHPFLNKFLPMALTNFDVNYTGSNTYATYYDGTPVHINMTLTFQELNPIYFEDYEALDKNGDTSVGY
jgi:hypothetical protein